MFASGEDIKYTPNPNYVQVKSEFHRHKYQSFVEEPETMAIDRRFIPSINEDNSKDAFQYSHALGYNLENISNPGKLPDYNNVVNYDNHNCKENQLILKKEALNEVDFHSPKQKEKTVGSGQKKREIKQKYTCDICNNSYKEKIHLDDHIDIFHSKGAAELPVSIRDNNPKATANDSHDMYKENSNAPAKENILFVCYTCNIKFSKKSSLDMHMDLIHKVPSCLNLMVCLFCGKSFDQQTLDKHILRQHPSWRPLSCNICGDSFALLSTLNDHQKIFHNDVYGNPKKIRNDKEASENVVRLTYTDCPIAENKIDSQTRHMFAKRTLASTTPKKMSRESFDEKNRKYIENSRAVNVLGRHNENVDPTYDGMQDESHKKRRKLEYHSIDSNRERDFQHLYQYECLQCQLEILTLDSLFRHVEECPKRILKTDSNSHAIKPVGIRRNIQLDCRMGGRESGFVNHFFDDKIGKNKSEIIGKKQALMEKMLNRETTRTNQILISCRFCEFTTTNFIEFDDHLMLHGN